jgi:hypothetical protein
VQVGVVDAGHDRAAAGVDDLRLPRRQAPQIAGAARGQHDAVPDRDRLVDAEPPVERQDAAVDDEQVGGAQPGLPSAPGGGRRRSGRQQAAGGDGCRAGDEPAPIHG